MKSFRQQLKAGAFQRSSSIKSSIHKFFGNFTITDDGYCDFNNVEDDNFFLLKFPGILLHAKRCKGGMR